MRRLACIALLLAIMPGWAADPAKPNTLTPKEVADGWLLLFDGETTFGWKIDGTAQVKDGTIVVGGDKETTVATTTAFGRGEFTFVMTNKNPAGGLLIEGGPSPLPFMGTPREITYTFKSAKPPPAPIGFKVPAGGQMTLSSIKYRPLDLQPIFNGKDLSGWKEHPGKKSKFTVQDGVINLKDGPGDLQTEGQWADFILQAECFSNGKHLNSGIFFRCRPNEYQQGYEAQIHNGWLPAPTKEYTIDTFDPDTGKSLKSEKVKSAAIDYGTGAIYRRVPARKEVAKDGEWFTMTVAAQGRHLATWVNGIQVVDWLDTRPVKDNARNGCKLEKGNISIQGHDPTTDLSFRNIRIAELVVDKK
jgi:Domain of Unknown Function (DUF1080)